jgi:hypothetical protein
MDNLYYQMMIKNAAYHLRTKNKFETDSEQRPLDVFEISEVLSILTCKLKEDIISDIISVKFE